MILGLSVENFTLLHVIISLVGILAGLVALAGMLTNRRFPSWTALFLATTVATSVTGFFFPSKLIGPPHVVGAISLLVLFVTTVALYGRGLRGRWRAIYVVGAVTALYLNAFVGVTQAFQKLPALHALARTGTEPPFLIVQAATLILFVALGRQALRRFHPPIIVLG